MLPKHLQALALILSVRMQLETIRVNVLGMLNLADICFEKKIHLTTYATGCIFHYDKDFPEGSGKGFKEADKPNFTGSYYSYTKACLTQTCTALQRPAQGRLIMRSLAPGWIG